MKGEVPEESKAEEKKDEEVIVRPGDKRMREEEPKEAPKKKRVKRTETSSKDLTNIKKTYKMESNTTYANVGGISDIKQELLKLVGFPMQHHDIFKHLGVDPPRGVSFADHQVAGKLHSLMLSAVN